jgi:hypothetical protein
MSARAGRTCERVYMYVYICVYIYVCVCVRECACLSKSARGNVCICECL